MKNYKKNVEDNENYNKSYGSRDLRVIWLQLFIAASICGVAISAVLAAFGYTIW